MKLSKKDEGETISFENIKKENLKLSEAVKIITAELESRNRELEIETALERVRTVAMSMRKPNDLPGICEILYKELQSLGFNELRNAMINIHNDEKGSFLNYDYSDVGGKTIADILYNSLPVISNSINQIRKSNEAFSQFSITGKELDEWKKFRKDNGEYDDPRIENTSGLYYYFYSIGTGSIGISTFSSINEEKLKVLKQFRNVFNLCYQRYSDIILAEAQAREAQIEVALERVRARSLAMHRSDELVEASDVFFAQLKTLGIDTIRTGVAIYDKENEAMEIWSRTYTGEHSENKILGVVPIHSHLFFEKCFEAWKKKENSFSYKVEGDEVKNYYGAMTSILSYPETNDYNPREYFYITFFPEGSLNVVRHDPLTEDEINLLQRFAKVFGLIYRRFLDLQKAEAQAREAIIELALERVRARTMAMHQSEELSDAASLLFQQVQSLGVKSMSCGFNIWTKEEKISTAWMSSPNGGFQPPFNLPHTNTPLYKRVYAAMQNGEEFYVDELSGESQKEHFKCLLKIPGIGEIIKQHINEKYKFPELMIFHIVFFRYGYLTFHTTEPCPEFHDIFKRFGKVFDQTYTRFLDLQKAEAQTREAKIEAALERVRSRTMGMQKSEELKEVIQVVYEQFVHLNIFIEHTGFVTDYKIRDDYDIWVADHIGVISHVTIPYFDSVYYNNFNEAKDKGIDFFATNLSFKEKNRFYKKLFEYIPGLSEKAKEFYFSCPGLAASTVLLENICLYIENFSGIPYSDEENDTLMRFGKVFQQTYTRFLDLQKAEGQAREAHIEAALERVRSRAMAMHKTDELLDAAELVYKELTSLEITSMAVSYAFVNEQEKNALYYGINPVDGKIPPIPFVFPHTETHVMRSILSSWKKQEAFYVIELDEKATLTHQTWVGEHIQTTFAKNNIPFSVEEFLAISPQTAVIYSFHFTQGYLFIIGEESLSAMQEEMLLRFTKVFEMTYTRFLDLQKAEAQTREAQIEAALERVRSKAMAMHKSEDLNAAVATVFEEMDKLNLEIDRCGIGIINKEKKTAEAFAALKTDQGMLLQVSKSDESMEIHPLLQGAFDAWLVQEDFSYKLEGEDYKKYYETLKDTNFILPDSNSFTSEVEERKQYYYVTTFQAGGLFAFRETEFSEEARLLMKRFAGVFNLTYKRFLDIKHAEAQTREAKIEASLEKVRGRAMAMHNSSDLTDAAGTLFTELNKLGINPIRSGFVLLTKNSRRAKLYPATSFDKETTLSYTGEIDFIGHPVFEKQYDSWIKKENYFPLIEGEELKSYYKILSEGLSVPLKYFHVDKKQFGSFLPFSEGFLFTWSEEPYSESEIKILDRFKGILDLTIRRFIDLKNAEAQARESTIEAALERVRFHAMAMQNSNDVSVATATMFNELDKLGIQTMRCGIAIINDMQTMEVWSVTNTDDGKIVKGAGTFDMNAHPLWQLIFTGWKQKDEFLYYYLADEDKKTYYNIIANAPGYADQVIPEQPNQNFQCHYFGEGAIWTFSVHPYSEAENLVLKKFTAVFSLTFRRYQDLQKAEAQAREAKIETALERVRSRALAMQEPEELKEVAQVLRHEMGLLGLKELETCSIYIKDENVNKAECWYAIKDIRQEDKKLIVDHISFNLNDTWVGREMLKFYDSDEKQISIVMQGDPRKEWIKYCEDKSGMLKGYYGEEIPDRTYHLYKFSHGAIGVATSGDITDESWGLLKRAASVFSLAYSRFRDLTQARQDLQNLKEEKQRAEEAFTELTSTQSQLIQSEKMASLGELTAGIAHEIQNPLNFVNNFSEVNAELIDELNQELDKGNFEEAIAIAKDIKENEEKIKHHGKRAEGIVKGMLQHSRSSSGLKEPTNINALADEYLRLAYHGLRAKDKSFNAKMETDFDESIGSIKVVSQDIGRVILNLITNAFYAVTEKKKASTGSADNNSYEPTVSVSTKKSDDKVLISVKDNGNGIPQKVLDKIFQPFFTTKPTGQGTGLGLSLSYDIVKAHGGELKVETKEGEGSEFIIELPELK